MGETIQSVGTVLVIAVINLLKRQGSAKQRMRITRGKKRDTNCKMSMECWNSNENVRVKLDIVARLGYGIYRKINQASFEIWSFKKSMED